MATNNQNQQNQSLIVNVERNLLSLMLHSHNAAINILMTLKTEDFLINYHQTLFQAVADYIKQFKVFDFERFQHFLIPHNRLTKVGGIKFITDIFELYISDERLDEYTAMIIAASQNRQLQSLFQEVQIDLQKKLPIAEILANTEKRIIELRHRIGNQSFLEINQLVEKVYEKIQSLANAESPFTGITAGISQLDQQTLGFQDGDLIILAARPGMGKTALAINFMLTAAANNYKIAFVSLEMPSEQIVQRMIGTKAKVNGNQIRTGQGLTNPEWTAITKAVQELKLQNIFIDDAPEAKLSLIHNRLRKLTETEKIDLIIIDYLQLLSSGEGRIDNRQNEISQISRTLKLMAREFNKPVICLSQLSRNVEKRENKRPIMSDLRDSGAIEQDADLILFLFRNDYYLKNSIEDYEPTGEAEIIISKHRNGPTGVVNVLFSEEFGYFQETN